MTTGAQVAPPAQVAHKKFSADEFHKMIEGGMFIEDDRVELLDGRIVDMTPPGSGHAGCVKGLNRTFAVRVGDRPILSVQDPLSLDPFSEPQPDFALLVPRSDIYRSNHPRAHEVLLVVEVADSSVRWDRETKIPLYARHGIQEAWLVNLVDQHIEVYREPSIKGYKSIRHAFVGDTVSPLAFPDIILKVEEILG